jgi:predicted DNA binding CopG/RHH family protein
MLAGDLIRNDKVFTIGPWPSSGSHGTVPRKGQDRACSVHQQVETMRKQYDFSTGRRNPYAKRLKKQVTIRLDEQTIHYFKSLAQETGVPYQTLINLYLRDCAASRRKLAMRWRTAAQGLDSPRPGSPSSTTWPKHRFGWRSRWRMSCDPTTRRLYHSLQVGCDPRRCSTLRRH